MPWVASQLKAYSNNCYIAIILLLMVAAALILFFLLTPSEFLSPSRIGMLIYFFAPFTGLIPLSTARSTASAIAL